MLVKEDALGKIDEVLRCNQQNKQEDFQFLFDALQTSENAHNSIANAYIMRYDQGAEDNGQLLLLGFIQELEQRVIELDQFLDLKWHQVAIDYIDIERSDFIDVKPSLGARFATYKLKLERCHESFAKQWRGTMDQIEEIFTQA